jgi:hypothetical protein
VRILRSGARRSRRSEVRHELTQRSDDGAETPSGAEPHPLPWRNTPTGGENHLTDARGDVVYVGCDASEMFRLLAAATARAGSPQRPHPPAPPERRPVPGPRIS